MFDGSTPTPSPAPFAVGYGNGYGYVTAPDAATTVVAAALTPTIDPMATAAMPEVDLDLTRAMAPVAPAGAHPPYTARPVGAAHPRRRLGRGLVLGGITLLVAGAGIGAVAVASSGGLAPVSASASGRPAVAAAASSVGSNLGRSVEPGDPATPDDEPPASVPVSIIVSPTVTRVPVPETVPTTAPPTTASPTTAPPATTPPTTTTTPPTTMPTTTPAFTSISAPASADCPTPDSDAAISFSWTATNATKVTLSIDGPGVYRTYAGASGSETVTFPCSASHTYLFTAHGSNGTVTPRSFTIAPK